MTWPWGNGDETIPNPNDELAEIGKKARDRWQKYQQEGEPEDHMTTEERRRQKELEQEIERREHEAIEEAKRRGNKHI